MEFISGAILFLSLGLLVLSQSGFGTGSLLALAFCFNLALLVFSWRRYRDVNRLEKARKRRSARWQPSKMQAVPPAPLSPTLPDRHAAMRQAMREGIPAGAFTPWFERQIDLASGRVTGFEVLTRWQHDVYGQVPIERVIAVAEQAGLIEDLSQAVFSSALREARSWDPALTLSINISPIQMHDPWLAERLIRLLVETGFPASRLEVEISERALAGNGDIAINLMNSLGNQGVRLALDDFGTTGIALEELRALPFHRLKIDRSLIQTIDQSPRALQIATSVAAQAATLGLPITAEGVETAHILRHLKDLGCTTGQGWHFGKPMPMAEARTLARMPLRVVGGWEHQRKAG